MTKQNIEISKPERPLLTALIITYNEERNIKEVLQNISFADEIIVIDSFSSDQTITIAKKIKQVKIVQHPFENYALQRNFAISQVTNPWILFIDADERLTPILQEEIIQTIQQKQALSAYYISRNFMFKNSRLFFSGWQTDKIIRLFQNNNVYYSEQKIVHEKLQVSGQTGKLKNKLTHYSYSDYWSYKQKMILYGKLKAKEALGIKTNPTFFHFYIRPIYQFIYQYFIRLGILDGKKGIIICYLNSLSVYVRFQELKRLKSQIIKTSKI
jgi:glycosyltransferase involved in cell wall biosynthesis